MDPPSTISGEIDLLELDTGTLYDFKNVFVRAAGELKHEHVMQTNMLRYVMANPDNLEAFRKLDVEELRIVQIYRDWSAVRAYGNDSYPQTPFQCIEVPVMPMEDVQRYMMERVFQIRQAIADPESVECTEEERWMSGSKFAVLKEGNKMPRLFNTETEAREYIASRKSQTGYNVTERKSRPIRCMFYCPVAEHCAQFQKENTPDIYESDSSDSPF